MHGLDEPTRKELIRLQKRLFRENRAKIHDAELESPPLYRAYEAAYDSATRRYEARSDVDELTRACREADIVYVGDYHTLAQSQKAFLKLMKRLTARSRRKLVIGMEFVQGKFQPAIDRFLAGRIAERTFLQRIDYRQHWPYDIWDNYKPIFEFARDGGHRILAIECNHDESSNLHARDSYAAWRIAEVFQDEPDATVCVLIGELHVAPPHLPATVQHNLEKIGVIKRSVTVYQNCEEIYWKLLQEGDQDTEVVRIRRAQWCLINTPPVVRQQSYLDWIDYDEGALEYSGLAMNFRRLAEAIAKFLRIPIKDAFEGLAVFGPGETEFMPEAERLYDSDGAASLRARVTAGDSFYLPELSTLYLGRLGTNFAGEAAAHFVRHRVSGWTEQVPLKEAVYAHMLHKALGFFGSKVINHKRKTTHLPAFHALLREVQAGKRPADDPEALVAGLVLTHKRWERGGQSPGFASWFHQDEATLASAVKALGYLLGEKLYYALVRGQVSRSEVRELFEQPLSGESEAASTYFHWVARVGKTRIPKRI